MLKVTDGSLSLRCLNIKDLMSAFSGPKKKCFHFYKESHEKPFSLGPEKADSGTREKRNRLTNFNDTLFKFKV